MKARGRDISAIMRKVHSRDTTPEVVFRKALWAHGLRYRTCRAPLAGKPDIVLTRARLIVFIDGDFWHGGQWRKRHLGALEDQFVTTPTRDYWLAKIRRNMQRDCAATASLMEAGWGVLRFWESQVLHELDQCLELTLRAARADLSPDPLSVLPAKTFVEFPRGASLLAPQLKKEGWAASEPDPGRAVALAAASLEGCPSDFATTLEAMPERPPLALLRGAREEGAIALGRLGYSAKALAGTGLVIGAPCEAVGGELPAAPDDANPVEWVARYFLNPLVSDLMRGRLLGRKA